MTRNASASPEIEVPVGPDGEPLYEVQQKRIGRQRAAMSIADQVRMIQETRERRKECARLVRKHLNKSSCAVAMYSMYEVLADEFFGGWDVMFWELYKDAADHSLTNHRQRTVRLQFLNTMMTLTRMFQDDAEPVDFLYRLHSTNNLLGPLREMIDNGDLSLDEIDPAPTKEKHD